MNDLVKSCVESRRTAIFNAYDVKNEDNLNKIEEFFKKLEDFANNYDDVMAFEGAFASSELNQEYMSLFTQIATTEAPKNINVDDYKQQDSLQLSGDEIAQMAADELVEGVTSKARGIAYREAYDKVRDIPGVGDAIDIKNKIDFFGRFRKNK